MHIGLSEIIIIVFLIIAFVKPENLKEYIKSVKRFTNMYQEVKKEAEEEMNTAKETANSIMGIEPTGQSSNMGPNHVEIVYGQTVVDGNAVEVQDASSQNGTSTS